MEELPVVAFASTVELRSWLESNHAVSAGVWVRLAKSGSGIPSVTFADLLDEGLCFGWSESSRRAGDATTYLQRFTPRRSRGTASDRNRRHVEQLIAEGRMTAAGLAALQSSSRAALFTDQDGIGDTPSAAAPDAACRKNVLIRERGIQGLGSPDVVPKPAST